MEQRRHNTRHAAALAAAAAALDDPIPTSSSAIVPHDSSHTSPSATSSSCSSPIPSSPAAPQSPVNLPKSQHRTPLMLEPRHVDPFPASKMASKRDMYDSFQAWALKTYGDSAKTKTVTRRKYNRILKILKGEEQTNAENSKFRFWVKAKGFRIGPPRTNSADIKRTDQLLYIPCSKASAKGDNTLYKMVAVVENFFDIIYGVHVEMDGRGGKHAGQKRTYKAIAEMYSFLPREAVTHFLMSCADCQKRMHLTGCAGGTGAEQCKAASPGPHGNPEQQEELSGGSELSSSPDEEASMHIDYSFPITTTYLKHMRSLGYTEEEINPDRQDSEDAESEVSEDPNVPIALPATNQQYDVPMEEVVEDCNLTKIEEPAAGPSGRTQSGRQIKENGHITWTTEEPLNMTKGDIANNHQDHSYERSTSPCNGCVKRETSATPDNLSAGTKDDDDDDDDDDPDKIDTNKYDPERLKAFNMFVRLFVDENLDRMVPISRQPKDKIQAIIDSCSRQFPEFGERARKRIRTYLKSCRRNKRTRESSSLEMGRSTHPHLTSALAEQILAAACENESQNAKRMRLGLKPIAADVERVRVSHTNDLDGRAALNRSPQQQQQDNILQNTLRHGRPATSKSVLNGNSNSAGGGLPYTLGSTAYNSPYRLVPNASTISNNDYQSSATSAAMMNGPTDLSMKTCGGNSPSKMPKYSLNSSEVAAVKQLIAGYRESAAFLLRSADELEQLMLQQN